MSKIAGAQMYTVREYTKTPAELHETLKKIREMGYTSFQASGLWHVPVDELAAMARGLDMKIVLTHTPYDRFINDLDGVIRDHHALDCGIAGIGGLPEQYRNAEGYSIFAKEFNAIAEELGKNGLKFSYHNHHWEFEKHNGKVGLDILAEQTNPENFLFTLDTYWVQAGGADPAAWIRKLKGRIDAIHLKDMTIIDCQQIMTEVLEGNLNWPDIFTACEEAGVKWYLVERDAGPTEALDSLRISYTNLKKAGFA